MKNDHPGTMLLDREEEPARGRPLRIAYVVHRFGQAGQERCISALVNGLPHDQVLPMVISIDDRCEAASWITRQDARVVSLGKRFANDPRLSFRLAKVLRSNRIDIAHSHNWGSLVETSIGCALSGALHVHAEHGLEYGHRESGIRGRLKPVIKRTLYRRADKLVAIARCVKQRISDVYGINEEIINLIPNGVCPVELTDRHGSATEIRRQLKIPDDTIIAGSVGRAVHVKGFDVAINAFARIAARCEKLHLVFVGGGPEKDALAGVAQNHDLSHRIHLVGHSENVGAWLNGFDFYFNSSRSEAMNLAVLEAMSCGLPIVAMDVGDNATMVCGHGDCGRVVAAGDEKAFGEALLETAERKDMRDVMGANSSAVFHRLFSVDRMVEGYYSLYRDLIPECV